MEQLIGQPDTAGAQADLIKDGTQDSFINDVIEASRSVPVLVDFWADWCGPCKQLAPVLEKVVRAAKGKVRLVKVDIEANRALAAQLAQVGLPLQSIPLVAAFWKGQILDVFQGALPESGVKKFVETVLKASGGGTLPATERLQEADTALETGRPDVAAEMYSSVIGEEEENPRAWGGWCAPCWRWMMRNPPPLLLQTCRKKLPTPPTWPARAQPLNSSVRDGRRLKPWKAFRRALLPTPKILRPVANWLRP